MIIEKIYKTFRMICIISFSILFMGWGAAGHKYINAHVILHLPPSMSGFIQQAAYFIAHASDADNRKGGDSQKPYILREGPRHFIDIDIYPEFNNIPKNVPKDLSILIARSDSFTIFTNGVNPWATLSTMDSLTEQIRRGDLQKAWASAADLGHYVGDGHQPLHATKDYDGRASIPGSSGIHSRYETGMLDTVKLLIQKHTVQYISQPIDFIFSYLYQANGYVDSIYIADISSRQESGYSGSGSAPASYHTALWRKTGSLTQLQIQRATEDYADLLYTAWVNGGSPATFAEQIDNPSFIYRLNQNYPNPFNPSTTISFYVGQEASVLIKVYDILGHEVTTLTNTSCGAGYHEVILNASDFQMASGVYLYKMEVVERQTESRNTFIRKLLLMK